MAGLSNKEAAFLALARTELAKKKDAGTDAAPALPTAAPTQPASPAPARVPLPASAAPPAAAQSAATQPAVAVDPAMRIAALIESERAATAAERKRHRMIFLAMPAAIAILAGIWILIRMWARLP